jgi:poly(hydroxyalkanoate) depolymerase family esterase
MINISSALPRTGLGATLQALKAATPFARGAVSDGGMRPGTFSPNPGSLDMRLHVPEHRPEKPALVVVLHGCTQDATGFAADSGWLALADQAGFAVLAPQQRSSNNPNRCFNWFEPQDMRRGVGEPASIAAMIVTAIAQHDLDPDRVYITGLSAGGAMAAVMLATYPEMFAGGAVIAGLPYGVAVGMPQAFQSMHGQGVVSPAHLGELLSRGGAAPGPLPRLTVWHGDADHVVNVSNAAQIAGQWAAGQGLAAEPSETAEAAAFSRATWRDPAGHVQIELNRVHGLGHGVPLETRGQNGLGRAAPFMLQAGVNSTLEIARFWGLPADADADAASAALELEVAAPGGAARPSREGVGAGGSEGLGGQVMAAVSAVPPHVQAIIANALTRGGLLK